MLLFLGDPAPLSSPLANHSAALLGPGDWLCKVLEEGAAAEASGQLYQELQGSRADVAWKDVWVHAVVQKLVQRPGGAQKSSSWPGKGEKERLDPCLNI